MRATAAPSACCNAPYIYCNAQKVNLGIRRLFKSEPLLAPETPLFSQRRLDAAFLLASDACFLEIQLAFHAAA